MITDVSFVSSLRKSLPPMPYNRVNARDKAIPQMNNSRIIFLNAVLLLAPIYLPARASPAYANPSMIYENSVNNCINKVLTASMISPCFAPVEVKNVVTVTRQSVRKNMSLFV